MPVGLLSLHLHIPGCSSLKEKRSRLKPLLARLHRQFNISAAEMAHQDAWQETTVACALVANDAAFVQNMLREIVHWVETNWPDMSLIDDHEEILR